MKQDKTPMASTKSEQDSDIVNNIENQVKMTKAKSRYHKAFYFSKGMPIVTEVDLTLLLVFHEEFSVNTQAVLSLKNTAFAH